MSKVFGPAVLMAVALRASVREVYRTDLTQRQAPVLTHHLKLGTYVDPVGHHPTLIVCILSRVVNHGAMVKWVRVVSLTGWLNRVICLSIIRFI